MDRPGDLGGSDSWDDPEPRQHSGNTPGELRERAVKMVFEVRDQGGKGHGEIAREGPWQDAGLVTVATAEWVS